MSQFARRLRGGGVRLAALLLAAAVALVACGSGETDTTSPASGEIDRDATLRYGVTVAPAGWDPHLERNTGERAYLWQVWDRLLMMDEKQQIQPGIATDWEFSEDGLGLTLTLREGVSFHDGTPVTSASVKASLDRAKSLEKSTMAADLAVVSEVVAVDERTVRLSLDQPAPYLLPVLATTAGAVINEKAIAENADIGTDPFAASSGAYRVAEFVPGEGATLERVEGEYWDPDAAQARTLELKVYLDASAALAALRTGELDVALVQAEEDAITSSISGTDLVYDHYATAGPIAFFLNPKVAPFDDPRVRQAVISAVNREEIASSLLGGEQFATSQGVAADALGYDPDADPYPHDVAEAKRLLAEAGFADGFSFTTILPTGFRPAELIVLPVQQQLAEIGIDMKINPVPSSDLLSIWRQGQTQGMMTATPARPHTYMLVNAMWFSSYQVCDPAREAELRGLMDAANAPGLTDEQRAQAYRDMVAAALDQATFNPFGFRPGNYVHSPRVKNVETMPWRWAADSSGDPRYLAVTSG